MTKVYFVLLLSSLYLLSSCKSASKAYERGNYSEAIEISIKKLQKEPDDYETRQLLKNAYNNAVDQHEDQIRMISNSKSDTRYERIYQEYVSLQRLYHMISRYPGASSVVQAKDYSEYLETYREKSADIHIEKARKYLEDKNRGKLAYRDAYFEYRKAQRFKPEDFELKQIIHEVWDMAITKVVVVPIDSYRSYGSYSSYQLRNFQDDIMRTFTHHMNHEFVRFYSEFEARSRDIVPDQVMELNLSRIHMGLPVENKSTREVSREVVVKEIVHKKDSVTKEYAKVYAKLITTRRTVLSEGDLVISIRDTDGRMIWADRFTGQHSWSTEFTTYTGDERALSDNDKALINKPVTQAPREDEVMGRLFQQIQNDLSYRLRNYYSRY